MLPPPHDNPVDAEEPLDTLISQSELLTRCVLFARVDAASVSPGGIANAAEHAHAIERCLKRMRRAAEAFGGRNFKPAGDGVLALFVSADAALQTACEMRQRVEDLPPTAGVKLSSRIGLDVGPLVADGDEAFGECVDNAVALAAAAAAGQVLASAEGRAVLSPAIAQVARPAPTVSAEGKPITAYEFVCGDVTESMFKAPRAAERISQAKLILTIGSDSTTVTARRKVRTLGRDIGNDLAVAEPRASRTHARIELRGNVFVLVDVSRNGTFLSLGGGRQLVLRKQEIELPEQGLISLGRPCAPDAQCVSFEIIR